MDAHRPPAKSAAVRPTSNAAPPPPPTAADKQLKVGAARGAGQKNDKTLPPSGAQTAPSEQQQQQKQRNDSFNLDKQIKQFSLNFSNRHFERQFRSTSDIASCISLVGLPITLVCAFLSYTYLYKM